jgi:hypothetical protein
MAVIPESHEVRRWRWRQEDAAFDCRDHLYGAAHRLWLLSLAVLALMAAS